MITSRKTGNYKFVMPTVDKLVVDRMQEKYGSVESAREAYRSAKKRLLAEFLSKPHKGRKVLAVDSAGLILVVTSREAREKQYDVIPG